jgi:spore germination cell wall hydrolase CwlJ-like protein
MRNFHIYERNMSVGITTQAILCLAMNVYHEARSEDIWGQLAVAEVTLNRVAAKQFPNEVCDVVWQRRQFSWTHDGKSDKPRDQEAWVTAHNIATLAIRQGKPRAVGEDVLFYHAEYVKPYWAASFHKAAQHGSHIFYQRKAK